MNKPASIISFVRCQPRGWLWKALTATGEEICEQQTQLPLVGAMARCIEELEATGDVEPEECRMEGIPTEEKTQQLDQGETNAGPEAISQQAQAADQRQTKRKRKRDQGRKNG
jgi:hypothetical protein